MITSKTINEKQNEDGLLKIQYAARRNFNTAEILNYISWLLCLLSAFMYFVPDCVPKYITIGIPVLLDIIMVIISWLFTVKVKNASELRNYFDSVVLMIPNKNITNQNIQDIKKKAFNIYEKHQSKIDVFLKNTGRDTPPGVKNWYEFKKDVTGVNAQYECQKQNVWWNKEMIKKRRICFSIIGVILLVSIMVALYCNRFNICGIIACLSGIAIKITERSINHYKYFVISIQIDTIKNHIENHLTKDNINELQELINERRSIPVLECNLIHKIKARFLSKTYDNIS